MPCFDGPYKIVSANPELSSYTLDLPEHTNIYPTFHVSELKHHTPNDANLYPSRESQCPGPFITPAGAEEWEIERILDKRRHGHGSQYLVRWHGCGPEADIWVPGQELEDIDALEDYETMQKSLTSRNTHKDYETTQKSSEGGRV